MSATALFVTGLTTGLIAGGASCAAVQGGLLAGAVGRRRRETDLGPVPHAARTRGVHAARTRGVHTARTRGVHTARTRGIGPAADGGGGTATTTLEREREPAPAGDASAVVPLGAFLSAKLVSHTLLGIVLGTIGAAAQPSPRTRAYLLIMAAFIMVVFALDMIGVKAVRGLVPRPPEAWTRRVRRSTRSDSMFTPALLGFLTVLLPCGVTLSMSLLAITSGSPAAGAAVMAGFVLGTMPLFAVLGYVLRQSTRVLRGRLSIVTGVVVLAVAAWTVNSALTLGGWGPDRGSTEISAASAAAVRTLPNGGQVITVGVGKTSYTPGAVVARPGVPTTLVLTTAGIKGCTGAFVIPDRGVQQILPETGSTTLELGTPTAGTLRYTCGMGMYSGRILFQEPAPGGAA